MTAMRISFVFLALLFSALYQANAQTLVAASCNATDVQAAFNKVTSTTTTVNIPAGTCNWTSQVTLTVPTNNTALSVIGAGSLTTTGGGDQTVIVDNYASNNQLLSITTASSISQFRLAGITFQGGNGSVKYNGIVGIYGNSQNVRVDHNHFNSDTYSPVTSGELLRIGGWEYGVADHNIFDLISATNGIEVEDDAYSGDANGDGAWADSTSLGSANFFFIENNTFNNGNSAGGNAFANDCFEGGKWVARFNVFNNVTLQTHPTTGSDTRGCRASELYDNIWENTAGGTPTYDAFYWDSGTGVVWGNAVNQIVTQFITLESDRSSNGDHAETSCTSSAVCPSSWGYCGTNFDGIGSPWDQNSATSTGYKCLDEPGTGKSDLFSGQFPKKCDATTGCKTYNGSWPNQASEPIYEWADAYQSVPGDGCGGNLYAVFCVPSDLTGGLTQNRDWYNNAQSWNGTGFTGTAFNGTTGTGFGTLANRPSTCAKGVGYWATDQGNWNTTSTSSPVAQAGTQGELFVCTATNTWTLYYTPYTYPHPLTKPAPNPPTQNQPSVAPQ